MKITALSLHQADFPKQGELNYKSRLILLFILIAIIPVFALSMVSAFTVLKFKDQLSNMYFGVGINQATLQEGNIALLSTKIDLQQYIGSQSTGQQASAIAALDRDSNTFSKQLENYKRISTSPIEVEFVAKKDLDRMVSSKEQILSRLDNQWNLYNDNLKELIILSKDDNFRQSSLNNAAKAITLFDGLENSYQDLITLNADYGKLSYEASNTVVRLAYFYEGIAASVSAACATAAAILVSKRVILGDLVKKTKIDVIETTLKDLLGEGADLILEIVRKEMPSSSEKRKY
jgi:hypothetical protein